MGRLPTRNIFIDTSVFEEQNFFHSTDIQSILEYARLGVITIFMTQISKIELINRMKYLLNECKTEHNKFVNSFNLKNFRILKNLEPYKELKPFPLNINEGLESLIKKLEINIKVCNIRVLNAENVNIDEIFLNYFKGEPPFSEGKKKHEFPDAFIIKTLEIYARKNRTRICILSRDNDFKSYKSKNLIIKDNITNLLVDITEYYSKRFGKIATEKITGFLNVQRESIMQLISESISDRIEYYIDYKEYRDLNLNSITFHDQKIISIREGFAEVKVYVKLIFSAYVQPTAEEILEETIDDLIKPKKVEKILIIPVDMEVQTGRNRNIKIKWINSTFPIKVEINKLKKAPNK